MSPHSILLLEPVPTRTVVSDWKDRSSYLLWWDMLGGGALQPTSTATAVRATESRTLTSDGPFAETKEQLGGYYVIEANDLDEAIEWAAKMPHIAGGGTVEVRPIMEFEN